MNLFGENEVVTREVQDTPKKKKEYQQLLALDTDRSVKEQFDGWLPISIIKPGRDDKWKAIIGDDGDETARRSADAKYLPGLRFSQFHPGLAELIVRYWSLEGDHIVDPFAGRATRGIVALTLGRKYEGYDVAPETFRKTEAKVRDLGGALFFQDGCALAASADNSADLIFTCPPYHRIEKYESSEGQLTDIRSYDEFMEKIAECARNCYRVLKPGKFVAWVCADFRDASGFRIFHADSLAVFQAAGFTAHDVVVIHNNSPFAPLQAGKVAAKRYTSKVHEFLLIFRAPVE